MDRNLNKLVNAFAEKLSDSDVVAAEQLAYISAAIVKERIRRGMTQKQFAKFMGVSQGMVSKWESENYNYSIETLAEICTKLGMELKVNMKANDCSSGYKALAKRNRQSSNNKVKFKVINGAA